MDSLRFFLESTKYTREIGTIFPTSKYTAKKMAREINGAGKEIVEFGSGMGVITKEILNCLPSGGRLTCFEINKEFCKCLRDITDPRLTILNENAKNLEKYVQNPDCIVSAIPLALLERDQRREMLEISKRAKKFIQIQYNCLSVDLYKRHFGEVKMKFSFWNIPPAWIYVCCNNHSN
jgi:phospholipid N-methyltransferase